MERHVSGRLVTYDEAHWELLEGMRARAAQVQGAIPGDSLVYGSVARGDVHQGSDVDLVVQDPLPSYAVELGLSRGFHILERRITIASPGSVAKATVDLAEGAHVTWPLIPERDREEGFYLFGGALDARATGSRDRVPGVTKRLLLVVPVPEGHVESSVLGTEVEAAHALGLPLDVVRERVRVLARRDQVGRTGVFRSVKVEEGETFEQVLERMADTTPAVRRQVRYRGGR